jgi:hypothetical protein
MDGLTQPPGWKGHSAGGQPSSKVLAGLAAELRHLQGLDSDLSSSFESESVSSGASPVASPASDPRTPSRGPDSPSLSLSTGKEGLTAQNLSVSFATHVPLLEAEAENNSAPPNREERQEEKHRRLRPKKSPFRPLIALLVGLTCLSVETAQRAAEPLPPRAFTGNQLLEVSQKWPERIEAGSPVPMGIVVRNVSAFAAEEVVVRMALPAGYDLLDASPSPARVNERLSWQVGRLNPGEHRLVSACLKPIASSSPVSLRIAVEAACQFRTESIQSNPIASSKLDLSVSRPETLATNIPTELKIDIRNTGDAPARDVILATALSPGLTHPSGAELETTLGTLEPGQTRTIPLQVTATRVGQSTARVTVEARGKSPISQVVQLLVEEVRLRVSARGPESLLEQFTGLFELTVCNDDAEVASSVSLTVALPRELAFVRASGRGDYHSETHCIRWEIGDMRPGEQRAFAWNGMGLKPGVAECKIRAQASPRAGPEIRWATRILPSAIETRRQGD